MIRLGEHFGTPKLTGPLARRLGDGVIGLDQLPESAGEFMPDSTDLARIALSLYDEAAIDPRIILCAENVGSSAMHQEALKEVCRELDRRKLVARASGPIAVGSI